MAEKHLILCHDQSVSAPAPLEALLEQLGASEYLSVLEDNEVGLDDLAGLSKDDLRSIGIPLGPAIRIVKHMNQMLATAFHLPLHTKYSHTTRI
jgi:hypothetical protein